VSGARRRWTGLARTTARTVAGVVATLLIVSAVMFAATNLSGTDAATAALGRFATEEQIEAYRAQQGLDEPLLARYWTWLSNVATGDWGDSLINRRPVSELLGDRVMRTLTLSLLALAMALALALVLGLVSAMRSGSRLDQAISAGTLALSTLPEFIVALAFLYVLGVYLEVLPPNSTAVSGDDPAARAEAYILPALSLAVVMAPYLTRMIRASVREVLATPYVHAATLRGVPSRRLILRHVLPNAAGPVVNVVALTLADILVGAVVVENVYGFPGLGQLAVTALQSQDVPLIQAAVLIAALGFLLLNLLADAAVTWLNPKLRRTRRLQHG
jgi:peptide/nickel transport system permease protein